jgi:hypothetical protein
MDFELTEEQELVKANMKEFCEKAVYLQEKGGDFSSHFKMRYTGKTLPNTSQLGNQLLSMLLDHRSYL